MAWDFITLRFSEKTPVNAEASAPLTECHTFSARMIQMAYNVWHKKNMTIHPEWQTGICIPLKGKTEGKPGLMGINHEGEY